MIEVLTVVEDKMKKTIEKMKSDFATLRTSRATPQLLENIKVEYYGSTISLNQVASIIQLDAKTLEIKPWDISILPEIEKQIFKSELGLTPQNDGKKIILRLPPLSQERRLELVKVIKKMSEEFRISIRNERREVNEKLKKMQKLSQITEDDYYKYETELQKLTENYIKKIDEIFNAKEKEILEI